MKMKIKNFFIGLSKKIFTIPRARIWWLIIFILIITLLAGFLDFPNYYDKGVDWLKSKTGIGLPYYYKLPFRLGLDLQGGTHLIYEADTSGIPEKDRDEALEGVRDVIERRVNAFGVAEPVVQTTKTGGTWRVIVELAGVKDVSQAIKMIGETPLLEFKEQNTETRQELTPEQQKEMDDYNTTVKKKAEEALKKAKKRGADFAEIAKEYSEDEATKSVGGDLGFITKFGPYSDLYEQAAKLKVGQVSNLIETDADINIIKLVDQRDSKEVKANHLLICWQGADRCEGGLATKEEAKKKIDELKTQATPENFVDLVKENSAEPGAAETGGDLGWFGKDQMVKPFEEAAFAMKVGEISEVVETQFGYHLIYKIDERPVKEYRVSRILFDKKTKEEIVPPAEEWKYTGLTGKQLKRAQVQFDPNTNAPEVGLEFNDEGKKLFGEITERNVGKPVDIFLDGEPISVPRVQEAIREGRAVITGSFTIPEAKLLAQRLNAGALPVPINLISQETIGATLGSESVQKSLFAALLGFLAVAVFMILYYRLPGLLAVLALVFYAVVVLALFKLIPVTLTLAGIAGFVLSVGMAVDANVLIFERAKEELRLGKSLGSAIDEGFKRAWPSIRDSNITTLISCFILFWFSTSMIKGFALTLSTGVIVSMLSALFITKSFLRFVTPWVKKNWWFGVRKR